MAPYTVYSKMNASQTHWGGSGPDRYNLRSTGLSAAEVEQVRGGGWTLEQVQRVVDQFVLHYVRPSMRERCHLVGSLPVCVTKSLRNASCCICYPYYYLPVDALFLEELRHDDESN